MTNKWLQDRLRDDVRACQSIDELLDLLSKYEGIVDLNTIHL